MIHSIEKWVIFSLSGAMKRKNINQITKIRESIFQGQLKCILQTPFCKSADSDYPGNLYHKFKRNYAKLRINFWYKFSRVIA